jgi:hypothetical protein
LEYALCYNYLFRIGRSMMNGSSSDSIKVVYIYEWCIKLMPLVKVCVRRYRVNHDARRMR